MIVKIKINPSSIVIDSEVHKFYECYFLDAIKTHDLSDILSIYSLLDLDDVVNELVRNSRYAEVTLLIDKDDIFTAIYEGYKSLDFLSPLKKLMRQDDFLKFFLFFSFLLHLLLQLLFNILIDRC